MTDTTTQSETEAPRKRKRWVFRGAAILLGLLVVVGLELLCRLLGWGVPALADDPYVGFAEVTPLFEQQGDVYEIAPARLKFFAAESFPAVKPDNQSRIFVLGGSTVQGRPYSIETTFGTWLELGLQADNPQQSWDVVNCGGLSYASYRLVPILEEVLTYHPDLIVLCTGHNEFLEDRSYDHLKPDSSFERISMNLSASSHLFHLMRHAMGSMKAPQKPKPQLKGEVDAILDYNDSLRAYHRDDEWRQQIVAHFEFNLRRMLELCRRHNVPVILIRPPSNLADSPPFKSEVSEKLSPKQASEIRRLMNTARENYRENLSASIAALEKAVLIDPRYALAWYELGQCYLTRKRNHEAKQAFLQAREEDVCPLRIVSELEDVILRVARETKTSLLDAYELLEERSRSGMLDSQWLADHVHPTVAGHQLMAEALQKKMSEINLCVYEQDSSEREQVWKAHLQSLDSHYFFKGQETLNSLRGWAAGRADGPPAAERFPHRVESHNSSRPKEFQLLKEKPDVSEKKK
ncbi:MAG: SGNH/GDSL hydrolase family protein [Planctomycetaceae bacterium]|nr:SGNH/GDSL hydrolase family protein [Planctomycetaceae bacterium]